MIESNRKPNKIWVDRGSEFSNRSIKSWLERNNIEMYSTHNEGKSVIAERSIKALKNKIDKHMNLVSKNVYINKLDDTVNKYINTYQSTIKTKPSDVKSSTYIEKLKLKLDILLEYQNIKVFLQKGTVQNWSEGIFVNDTLPWTYVINDLKDKEIVGTFYENKLNKQIKKSLELKR